MQTNSDFCSHQKLSVVIHLWFQFLTVDFEKANFSSSANQPINSQIKFAILLTDNHTFLIMLAKRS